MVPPLFIGVHYFQTNIYHIYSGLFQWLKERSTKEFEKEKVHEKLYTIENIS